MAHLIAASGLNADAEIALRYAFGKCDRTSQRPCDTAHNPKSGANRQQRCNHATGGSKGACRRNQLTIGCTSLTYFGNLACVQLAKRRQKRGQHGDHFFIGRIGGLGLLAGQNHTDDALHTRDVASMALAHFAQKRGIFLRSRQGAL